MMMVLLIKYYKCIIYICIFSVFACDHNREHKTVVIADVVSFHFRRMIWIYCVLNTQYTHQARSYWKYINFVNWFIYVLISSCKSNLNCFAEQQRAANPQICILLQLYAVDVFWWWWWCTNSDKKGRFFRMYLKYET